jgi:tetratricopeptide (TPR) repeat protein
MRGDSGTGLQHMRAAGAHGDALTALEPGNSKWLEYSAKAKNYLAYALLISGEPDEAAQQNAASCAIVARLLTKDPRVADWRAALRECWLIRGYVALAKGENSEAANAAEQAIRVGRSVHTANSGADAFGLARAYRLLGDARSGMRDSVSANEAWNAAFQALPRVPAEMPTETQEHAIILQRLGRTAEAQQLQQQLAAAGYRLPEVRRI